ncbi:MAG: ferrochelatase, partial [Candidatus Xenobia bacterium]
MTDAVLLLSFGGPERPEDVMPFLRRVTAGRNIPDARLEVVAQHYQHFGGKSPINDQNRALLEALRAVLPLPVYWGNRNWDPLLADTLRQMAGDGVTRAFAFVTSAYGSFSGCRQYLEDVARAREAVPDAPVVEKLRLFHNHPGFIAANADRLRAAWDGQAAVIFTAHSVPMAMA